MDLIVGSGFSLELTVNSKYYTRVTDWVSSNPSSVMVGEYGRVTGIRPGTATITATYNGAVCTCKVTVKAGKNRTEVTGLLDQDVWKTAQATNAGTVFSYPENAYGGYHYCEAQSRCKCASAYQYYTGISDYNSKAAYEDALYSIRFEATKDGSIALIESSKGHDYTFGGLYLGMSPDDATNMLGSRGYKFLGFKKNVQTFRHSENKNCYITFASGSSGIQKITTYNSEIQ